MQFIVIVNRTFFLCSSKISPLHPHPLVPFLFLSGLYVSTELVKLLLEPVGNTLPIDVQEQLVPIHIRIFKHLCRDLLRFEVPFVFFRIKRAAVFYPFTRHQFCGLFSRETHHTAQLFHAEKFFQHRQPHTSLLNHPRQP